MKYIDLFYKYIAHLTIGVKNLILYCKLIDKILPISAIINKLHYLFKHMYCTVGAD